MHAERVIIFDTKDVEKTEIQVLLKRKNVVCIGVVNVPENLCERKRKSFETSMWMEIKDARAISTGKKYPLLNLPLLPRKDPGVETQAQTILGKFSTHEYRTTDRTFESNGLTTGSQKLRAAIMEFFSHYRSPSARHKYPILSTCEFEKEFEHFEKYIKAYWSLKTCEQFYMSIRTNAVESFFATPLFYVRRIQYFLELK